MPLKRFFVALVCIANLLITSALAQTFPIKKRKQHILGQIAIVSDERLSAMRTQPDIQAPLIVRLRRDRQVGIIGKPQSKNGGPEFYPVMISRNQKGWVITEAFVLPQKKQDAARMLNLIATTNDNFIKAKLAHSCATQFRGTPAAATALLKLGQAAESAALRMSANAKKRVDNSEEYPNSRLHPRDYVLNYSGLDRYNKIGVTFNYDEVGEQLVYDGKAYRELLRLYPRSPEAAEAKARLEAMKSK